MTFIVYIKRNVMWKTGYSNSSYDVILIFGYIYIILNNSILMQIIAML